MKVLIVGGGGREHAIALKIKENPEVTALYAAPGNGGIAQIATCLPFKATDVDGIVRWAAENKVDFVIVAPDDPLCLGMVDALAEQGIPAFGPRKNAAIIEGSKVFSKNLMKKYGIPTAAYETFDDYDAAVKYLQTADMPIVVKADGSEVRRVRRAGRHRGVPDRPGSQCAGVHRRQNGQADGVQHGSQARA